MLISMAEFSSIFGALSALGGALIGLFCGAAFAFCFAALRSRQVPLHLVELAIINFIWIVLPVVLMFVVFRSLFGVFEFHPTLSLAHFFQELVLVRAQYFFGGAFFGLLLTLLLFVGSIAHGIFDPEDFVIEESRTVMPTTSSENPQVS